MSDVVYVLGAGVNRIISWPGGGKPPLAVDFFQQYLGNWNPENGESGVPSEFAAYIERYFKRTLIDLKNQPFDMEECFTLLDLQSREAVINGDKDELIRLKNIVRQFVDIFAVYLEHFSALASTYKALIMMANDVLHNNGTIITFNYDTILESVMMKASGTTIEPEFMYYLEFFNNPLRLAIITAPGYRKHIWEHTLGYGVVFDKLIPPNITHISIGPGTLDAFTEGTEYYSLPENELHSVKILKLHGSINWYSVYKPEDAVETSPEEMRKQLVLLPIHITYRAKGEPMIFGKGEDIFDPLIITPTSRKPVEEEPILRQIWSKAREELKGCKRLIIIGYSFPPTDFHVKRLFLEAFADSSPEDITIVNPASDSISLVRHMTHFKGAIRHFNNLEEMYGITSEDSRDMREGQRITPEWLQYLHNKYSHVVPPNEDR